MTRTKWAVVMMGIIVIASVVVAYRIGLDAGRTQGHRQAAQALAAQAVVAMSRQPPAKPAVDVLDCLQMVEVKKERLLEDWIVMGTLVNTSHVTLPQVVVRVRFYDYGGATIEDAQTVTRSMEPAAKWEWRAPCTKSWHQYRLLSISGD